MEPEAFKASSEDQQKQGAGADRRTGGKAAAHRLRRRTRLRRQQVASLRELNRQTATFATEQAIEDLRKAFAGYDELKVWIGDLEQDVLEHFDRFRPSSRARTTNPLHLHDNQLGSTM
ncbi:MAG: hypothetical protein R3E68_21410 [Burkholderiaceae bacterium]